MKHKHIIEFKNKTYAVLLDNEKLCRWILNRIYSDRKINCVVIIELK